METQTTGTVTVRRRFNVSPERVFDAWLDPASIGQWLFATPTGTMIKVELDPKVGGSFCIVENRNGQEAEHIGTYLEIDRSHTLVFSFAVNLPPEQGVKKFSDETLVRIIITPQDNGCELTLTHENILTEYISRTQSGWSGILEGLAVTLGNHP